MLQNKETIAKLTSRLSISQRDLFVAKAQCFLRDEYDLEVGNFDLEEMLQFFIESIGSAFYNQGIEDGCAYMASRMQDAHDESQMLFIE